MTKLIKTFYILTFTLGLLSCTIKTEKVVETKVNETISKTTNEKINLHKLKKMFTVGDFDGDGKKDTLIQHNFSRLTMTEIDSSANPYENEWDTVVKWFYDQEADVYISFNQSNRDTIHLGTAQGLYCLLNIGDNNSDDKDEIALVVDYCDFSRVNSCKVFSLCNNRWLQLKQFGIHEGSFDFTNGKPLIFSDIKGHLEKQNGKWVYMDYLQDGYENQEDVGKMVALKLDRCK